MRGLGSLDLMNQNLIKFVEKDPKKSLSENPKIVLTLHYYLHLCSYNDKSHCPCKLNGCVRF